MMPGDRSNVGDIAGLGTVPDDCGGPGHGLRFVSIDGTPVLTAANPVRDTLLTECSKALRDLDTEFLAELLPALIRCGDHGQGAVLRSLLE